MSTVTAARPVVKSPRKPRPKPERSVRVRLALPEAGLGFGVLSLRVGKAVSDYFVNRLPCAWGEGFRLEKFSDQGGEVYELALASYGRHSCECLGFLRPGHCKHVEGLLALRQAGQLPTAPVPASSRFRSLGDF